MRYQTPPRSRPGLQILQESPGTVEERYDAERMADQGVLPIAQKPDFSEQWQSLYYIYISVTNPGASEHMTLRRTIVNGDIYSQLLQKLRVTSAGNSAIRMSLNCKIGLELYHDGPTGLMSPSKSIQRAFLCATPSSVRHWIKASETLNQSAPHISELLGIIPDTNVELGYHPLGHTTQSVCPRGTAYSAIYTQCCIEMRRIADSGIGILSKNIARMDELKKLISITDGYRARDPRTLSEDFPEMFHGNTIAEALEKIEEINATGNRLTQNRQRITPQFSQKWTNARVAFSLIREGYQSIYEQIDDDLRPLFKAAGPNVAVCHMIASLALMALRRDMGQIESQTK